MRVLTQTKPLYQQAYEEIKKSIFTGVIRPGSKLVVSKLADQLQISRTPLREALRQLHQDGLLTMDKTGAMFVIKLDKNDFEELCFCRLTLEKQIIRLVVDQITDEQLELIEEVVNQSEHSLMEESHMELLDLNTKFHELLIHSCPNRRMIQLLEQVRSLLLLYRANILKFTQHNREIVKEHRKILEAVKERDTEKAVKVIEEHLLHDLMRGRKMFDHQNET